jgi:hypothetical protein
MVFNQDFQLKYITIKKYSKYKRLLDFLSYHVSIYARPKNLFKHFSLFTFSFSSRFQLQNPSVERFVGCFLVCNYIVILIFLDIFVLSYLHNLDIYFAEIEDGLFKNL